jgi:hypothetical protein
MHPKRLTFETSNCFHSQLISSTTYVHNILCNAQHPVYPTRFCEYVLNSIPLEFELEKSAIRTLLYIARCTNTFSFAWNFQILETWNQFHLLKHCKFFPYENCGDWELLGPRSFHGVKICSEVE